MNPRARHIFMYHSNVFHRKRQTEREREPEKMTRHFCFCGSICCGPWHVKCANGKVAIEKQSRFEQNKIIVWSKAFLQRERLLKLHFLWITAVGHSVSQKSGSGHGSEHTLNRAAAQSFALFLILAFVCSFPTYSVYFCSIILGLFFELMFA